MDSKNRYGAPLFCFKNRPWRPNRFLDACWSPFGSLLVPFLAPFGLLLVPFGSFLPSFSLLSLLFGSLLGPLRALKQFKKRNWGHPRPQRTRNQFVFVLLISETIFVQKMEHFPHEPGDNRRNPHLWKPLSATTCGTLP